MLQIQPRRVLRPATLLMASIIIFVIALLLAPTASAHSLQPMAGGPTIDKVSIGFDGMYQDGNWTPIQIDLSNTGNDFTGKVSINVPSSSPSGQNGMQTANMYQEAINLPPGAKKHITISAPINLKIQGFNAHITMDLLDGTGHSITHRIIDTNTNTYNQTLVGVLTDTPNNFGQLNLALSNLFSPAGQVKNLSAATLPKQAQVLKNFNAIVIDDFTSSNLSQEQTNALQSWVNQGGNLILAGGPEWKRTLNTLPASLMPATIKGTGTLAAGKQLLPVRTLTKGDQSTADTVKSTIPISTAQAAPNSTTILADGKTPLIVQQVQGQGTVYYLAYDPTIEPLASWQQTNQLWSTLLLRSLGDQALMSTSRNNNANMSMQGNNDYFGTMIQVLQTLFPNAFPSIWLILALLLSYVAILGPLRLLLVRILKRRTWSWRIVLSTIVVFTFLSYGLALQQKGSAIINSSITLLQLNAPDQTGTSGHATTFLGVFVPSQGDFQVHVPGASLVQPIDQNNMPYSSYNGSPSASTQRAIFTTGTNSTDINLQGVDIWTTRTLMTQSDTHTTGGLKGQLQIQQDKVSGTVTNTLPYALSDAFVLVGDSYVAIGELPSNSSKQITLDLKSRDPTATNSLTIADQIANSRGLQSNPNGNVYTSGAIQSSDVLQHHVMVLEALGGGYCDSNNCYHQNVQSINNNGNITKTFIQNNGNGTSNRDPLLLSGAGATLIGWAKDLTNNNGAITVNGQTTNGSQETVVQAPLDVNFSGPITFPASFINSQVVSVQQNAPGNVQEPAPGTYMITTGSMTLEYTLPVSGTLKDSAINLTSSAVANRNTIINIGPSIDINHIQSYLYNWQKQSWDAITFSQFSCSVNNAQAYIGPNGRILLHLSNHDTNVVFDKPALVVQGTITQ
ncbi:hypothetical protein [Dictyobacter alpinus]|nr:hypothetical protein [Dictyobacter alpinus]